MSSAREEIFDVVSNWVDPITKSIDQSSAYV